MSMTVRDDASTYPAAPWTLRGWGLATIGFVETRVAASFVPDGASLVSVAPGKTLGGLFFLSYETGSLAYRELNIVAGLIRVGRRLAFLLPRLYVDSAASLAGGRAIWAVPKELATFDIAHSATTTSIEVQRDGSPICRLSCPSRSRGWRLPMPLPLPSIGVRDDAFLFFTGHLLAAVSPVRAKVELPPDGEFGALQLDRPWFALRAENVILTVPAAHTVPRAHPARVAAPAAIGVCAESQHA